MYIQYFRGYIALFLLLLSFPLIGFEDDKGSISGKIHFNRPGIIFVYLVDEEHSKVPLSGVLLKIYPDQNAVDAGFVSFLFSNLEQGTYGIRCFQDLNNNGKLDKGLFGPSEPWGFSWNKQPPPNGPSFSNYSHRVSADIRNIEIHLSE